MIRAEERTFDLQALAPAIQEAVLQLLAALLTAPAAGAPPTATTLQVAEAILAAAQDTDHGRYPRGESEQRILDALASMAPLPATPKQIAFLVRLPDRQVLTTLQALAVLETVEHPRKGYYRHRERTP